MSLWWPSDEELTQMTDAEVADFLAAVEELRRAEEAEWAPQDKQALATFLAGQADEILYGGAAGGGKSEWLLHYALDQMLAHGNNRGGIFRRVFPSLQRTLIPRSKQFYPEHGGVWNGVTHSWSFPNGSVLEMGSLQYADSILDHQGAEYGFIGFEEVTEFLESQVDYMVGRLRAPAPGIRPHMAATANPGGSGHRWVKRRWVKPKEGDWREKDGRPVAYRPWRPAPTLENPEPNLRVFVPATLADNPKLMARDPGYINRLRALAGTNKALLKAMETGDWDAIDAIEGALWTQTDLDGGRVPRGLPQRIGVLRRVVAVDPSDGNEDGKGDSYGVSVVSMLVDGRVCIEYSASFRMNPRKMAEATLDVLRKYGAEAVVIERNHGGKWVKQVFRDVDRYVTIHEVWASDGKITRARPVAALFERDPDDPDLPYKAVMAGEHPELEEQLTTFTGQAGEASPNELDAMVWGVSFLAFGHHASAAGQYRDERLEGRR